MADLESRLHEALGDVGDHNQPSPDLFAAVLPPEIGSAWLFGTEAAYEDWLSPVCWS